MICQIDQSNKIEQTEKDTVLVLANGTKYSVSIKAKEKRTIQNEFRRRGEPRNFIIFTFSCLLVVLFKKVKSKTAVVIDLEYKGKEEIIIDRLIEYSRAVNYDLDKSLISFKAVGKNSPAHKLAGKVSSGKQKSDLRVSAKEVLEVIFTKKDRASRRT